MNKIHMGINGKKYVRVYFMDFIELEDFKAGREIILDDTMIVSFEEVGEISWDEFGKG